MSQPSTEPEYILEKPLVETHRFIHQSKPLDIAQVEAELVQLYAVLTISIDTLAKAEKHLLLLLQSVSGLGAK